MPTRQIPLRNKFPMILHSHGLPIRVTKIPRFDLMNNIAQYKIGDEKIVNPKRQVENFDLATDDQPGWLMYVCANGIIDKARLVAANIMYVYAAMHNRDTQWINNFDNLKNIDFRQKKLVVLDALFFDSNAYRRDKIYEVINYNCNVPNQSVLVIGQNTDPRAMATQLGMKPNLALMTK